jgi:hypothetical protein
MGIARRKAGTVVSCPKCAGQVVVPTPPPGEDDGSDHPETAGNQPPPGKEDLFERSDFEKVFTNGPAAGPQILHPPKAANPFTELAPKPTPAGDLPEYEAVPLGSAKRAPRGIFLTPGVLLVVSGLVIVLMGLAFFLGLLLGRS